MRTMSSTAFLKSFARESKCVMIEERYDVIVVGAGHAGCEAALAAARLGMKTIIFTVSVDSIALMPCNPNIGGTSKGHLVRELDALGGEMGHVIDKTFIQSRMLNESKGPAVHSLRAQADKQAYIAEMRRVLERNPQITIRQAEISTILTEDAVDKLGKRRCIGVKTVSGSHYYAGAVVLATGVYLNARCVFGEVSEETGPNGLKAATKLTASLLSLGIEMRRFKTGTPARVDGKTLDYSKMQEQKGDVPVVPFSFDTDPDTVQREQVSCWLTHTGSEVKRLIEENIDRSPLYNGSIQGTGPRYCPSIEDKVMKFPDKEGHQIFVEPEGLYTDEMYLGGMSSSLPEDVQYAVIHATPGLENAVIVRNAYAIEYDCIDARQLTASLAFKEIPALFAAGQINGSSGYEEAAAQGLVAGINAARLIQKKEPFVLDRSEAYIGVLIDDLVTKESHEPYRMMTSRSEYRLLLRHDNADLRLSERGYELGLVGEEKIQRLRLKRSGIEAERKRLMATHIGASAANNELLQKLNSTPLKTGISLAELIKRPELNYELIAPLDTERPELPHSVCEQVNIELKYEGYIRRQEQQVKQFKRLEHKLLPEDLDYESVGSLRLEAVQKLKALKPRSIGQASRISGVSPADISVLLVWLEANKHRTGGGI